MDQLDPEEAKIICDIHSRQAFNWNPSLRPRMANSYESLHLLRRQSWLDRGLLADFGLPDDETAFGSILYDDSHLRFEEAAGAIDGVFRIFHWMTAPENWKRSVDRKQAKYDMLCCGMVAAPPYAPDKWKLDKLQRDGHRDTISPENAPDNPSRSRAEVR
ncbi:MAG: hypothetical protein Q9182_007508 [Xanthomendoza sp. 2 TL-2023]